MNRIPPDDNAAVELMRQLRQRRKELGMSMRIVAEKSGLGLRTVQRVLSGKELTAKLTTVLAIAEALRVHLQPIEIASSHSVRRQQAKRKAAELAAMVQATSALEAQAVPAKALREIEEQIASQLIHGSRRQLWSS
jgi:transcriptional regulator with XRE-family HTH domain